MKENAGSYRATLYGYNYDDLYEYASKFKTQLLTYRRIKEVLINPEFSWYKDDYQEFGFNFDKEKLSNSKIEALNVFNTLRNVFAKEIYMGYVFNDGENQQIKLNSAQSALLNIWDLENSIFNSGKTSYKIKNFATIEKIQSQQKIVKENQQYKLCVQYEYIGAYEQGHKVHELVINSFRESLPAGYNIKNENEYFYNWGKKENNQYWLIGIVFAIIFFCSSVLFNSVRQALYVIFIIPISFIGVFLTFYWFKLNFDQGGFAAFIILSGIVVNTNIYLLYAFKSYYKTGRYTLKKAYLKAWNAKFRPTFLAIVSTVIGFIPFIIGYQESFWYPLAAGTIGGLLFSFVAVYVVLPIMIVKEKKH
jgi:multidrug efflux pump subunit AcrB